MMPRMKAQIAGQSAAPAGRIVQRGPLLVHRVAGPHAAAEDNAAPVPDDLTTLLSDLVAIDSVNPALVPGGAGEGAAARHVEAWARAAGLEAEHLEATPGRPSVLVRAGGSGGGRTLLLCGHLDTVTVDGMTDPHAPRIEGDRLYGRGAYDMKAGVAAALIAARAAARHRLRGDVVVAAVADEEHASLGVQEALAALGGRADAAIVTEPTELALLVAHKGFVWSEIEVTGRAAHGSRPHLGVDAIVKTGPVLTALGELESALAADEHPLLGRGSVHASVIEGGIELSSIPASCTLGIERRTLPGETQADVEAELDALLERCRAADPALEATRRTLLVREPFAVDAGAEIATLVRAAAGEVLGDPPPVAGGSFWADSAFIAAAGVPTVLFGPCGEGAHAIEEWVDLPSTAAVADVLTRVVDPVLRMSAIVNPALDPQAVPPATDVAAAFHATLPGYAPTPVRDLPSVAAELGLGAVQLKDESERLGLPAFKVLGASWAVERALREARGAHTLVAASAGNHGRAVAHVAAARGLRCRVFLPARSLAVRREAIAGEGAEVVIVDGDYEEAVARSAAAGSEPGVLEIADVGDAGGPPEWVIDGYATLFAEAAAQAPHDVVLVPVGVGSLAAAAARHGAAAGVPVVGVEPDTAACLAASLAAGAPTAVATPGTTMAGLDCAEVSAAAWPSLHRGIAGVVTVSDAAAATARDDLDALGLAIGECGAAALAGLRALAGEAGDLAATARIGPGARALLIATEGRTAG